MCDNGFGESGCKGSPIQSKVSGYHAQESSIYTQCFGGVYILHEILMFHWFWRTLLMIVCILLFCIFTAMMWEIIEEDPRILSW